MTRTRRDIHFDNGAIQTVFHANRMFVFCFLQHPLNVCHLAQPTNDKPKRGRKVKDTSAANSAFDGAVLAPTDQDGKSI